LEEELLWDRRYRNEAGGMNQPFCVLIRAEDGDPVIWSPESLNALKGLLCVVQSRCHAVEAYVRICHKLRLSPCAGLLAVVALNMTIDFTYLETNVIPFNGIDGRWRERHGEYLQKYQAKRFLEIEQWRRGGRFESYLLDMELYLPQQCQTVAVMRRMNNQNIFWGKRRRLGIAWHVDPLSQSHFVDHLESPRSDLRAMAGHTIWPIIR